MRLLPDFITQRNKASPFYRGAYSNNENMLRNIDHFLVMCKVSVYVWVFIARELMNTFARVCLLLGLIAVVPMSAISEKKSERPNIVLIMVDDMGYSDIGCYGSEIETPNLDGLAANGIRFTRFYNSARCCPTRASLMTGLAPHQAGIGHMTNSPGKKTKDGTPPAYQGFMNKNCVTLGEVLKSAGYNTLMTGKWHLSGNQSKDNWPIQRGFDKYYGCISGATEFFMPEHPRGMFRGNEAEEVTDPTFYTTDAFTDNAMRFIKEASTKNNDPFFLYLAYTAPHCPLQAPKETFEKYRGKYIVGWDKLRAERHQRQIEMGIVDPKWELPENDGGSWDKLKDEKKQENDVRMALHAAMVDRIDQNIGRLIQFLKASGKFDNTLILFLSDNGSSGEGGVGGSGKINLNDPEIHNNRTNIKLARGWTNMANTPFRKYKKLTHEGGIATPMIAHWPAKISAKGQLYREPAAIQDFMATFVDLSGATYPEKFNGNEIPSMEGISLRPAFAMQPLNRKAPLCIEHENHYAIIDGDWKLVQEKNSWELYNLKEDRTEMNNLSTKMPERVKELSEQWNAWANRCKVFPKPAGKSKDASKKKSKKKKK